LVPALLRSDDELFKLDPLNVGKTLTRSIRQRAVGESNRAPLTPTNVATPLVSWYYLPNNTYRRRRQHIHIVTIVPIIVHIPATIPIIPPTPRFEPPPPPPLLLLLLGAEAVVGADAEPVLGDVDWVDAGAVLEEVAAAIEADVDAALLYPQTDCPPSPAYMISATVSCRNPGAYSLHAVFMRSADVVRISQPQEV
jgi:hypothetical protein